MIIFRLLPMLAVMALIFFLSHTPGNDLPPAICGLDKLLHALAYATLAATCLYALHPATQDRPLLKPGLAVIFFCLFYGLTDEFHQSFIAGRSPSWQDIVADTIGATLAVLVWGWYRRRAGLGRRSIQRLR